MAGAASDARQGSCDAWGGFMQLDLTLGASSGQGSREAYDAWDDLLGLDPQMATGAPQQTGGAGSADAPPSRAEPSRW